MTLSKKEKTLLIIFVVLVYSFVFVKFVVMSSIPKIKEAKSRIQTANIQLSALERDYNSIDEYKKLIEENQIIDERLGEYLANNAGLSDSIEFVENLALLMGTSLKSISLGSPQQLSEGETTYYAFPINFSTALSENELSELLKFCEGGSRKISVSLLNISPAKGNEAYDLSKAYSNEQLLSVNIGLVFYSMDKDAADNLVKFTRAAFERFIADNDMQIFIEDLEDKPDNSSLPVVTTNNPDDSWEKPTGISLTNADFIVYNKGFLYAGYNFETYASFNYSETIRSSIKVPIDVSFVFGRTQYTIQCVDENGNFNTLTGNLPSRDFTLFIHSNVNTKVKENENIWVNVKIRNDSDKSIFAKIEQTGGRVRLMDRNGNEITRESEGEKVYL